MFVVFPLLLIWNFYQKKYYTMALSESGERLRKMIHKAIDDSEITRDEYDQIMHIALEDGHIDNQEKALLRELQNLIEERLVKFVQK